MWSHHQTKKCEVTNQTKRHKQPKIPTDGSQPQQEQNSKLGGKKEHEKENLKWNLPWSDVALAFPFSLDELQCYVSD